MQIRNKITKTIMTTLLSVIMMLSLATCGSTGNSNTQSINNSTQNVTNETQNQETEGSTSTPEKDPASPESGSESDVRAWVKGLDLE